MKLTNLIPMLNVSNLEASLDFYHRVLDFQVVSPAEAITEWRWATIRSGDTELMLSESDCDFELKKGINPQQEVSWPSILYFYPDDVDALYAHVTQQGFTPTPLESTIYGMQEFSLQDPDGHLLSFGQELNGPS